ncbi:BTB/POZ domain-containing protein At5g48130 [Amborella trichopoda]|uniref:NPH3 domain-containing protein n=1 Tax=Amborella trichopoda TaxID=13333 RepID=W1NVJ8_AMBTC|nr:BTB/POZ domain-containing protein At5g48130 [Amborella trichopoda]ERM99642.1 hypothetical protein AMTR_s00088p00177890 [Amborella trichopoda]|eukprot:XP_006836789.1 BTB/POZ domain-containing protein At5g48130 [Amborella trichopoda]
MGSPSPKYTSLGSTPLFTPIVGELLKKRIQAWSIETGLPATVRVCIGDKTYNLHKHQLMAKSGYFRSALSVSHEAELPKQFPGGPQAFEMVALFCYGSVLLSMDPFNVATLRCAAEFLEMHEDYSAGNLCERSDLYLNQVVLQRWEDTLIVLQKSQILLPWAEDLLMVSRCIESLAFMACMEVLDPEQRGKPVPNLQALANQPWNSETVREIAGKELWIKDLIALPFGIFERIIGSMRRQGMEEKFVSPIIVFYANKWVLSRKTHLYLETMSENNGIQHENSMITVILDGLIDLLPLGKKTGRVIPVGFLFSLLSKALNLDLSSGRKEKLKAQITSLLHFAQKEDVFLPPKSVESITSSHEFETIVDIFSNFASLYAHVNSHGTSIVADLWDKFLTQVAPDPYLGPSRFMDLLEIVPISARETHDHLYTVINTFLSSHPDASQHEKICVCRHLNCEKLSQETCIQAVRNEFMPLRLIIQALFAQQLKNHRVFKDCSDSFRYISHSSEFSGSQLGQIYQKPNNQRDSPYKPSENGIEGEDEGIDGAPLGSLLEREMIKDQSESMRREYESTSFRVQKLEEEIMSLKTKLQWRNPTKESVCLDESRRVGKPLGHVSSCIGSMSWVSHRKYANRLLKVFYKIRALGWGKSKRKQAASTPNPCHTLNPIHDIYDC